MKLLHIDSSILQGDSVSRDLTAKVVAMLRGRNPGLQIKHLDLAATPLGHLAQDHLAVQQGASAPSALAADLAAGQRALEDFLVADVVVVGAPMYNFGVPSQLKAWLDRLAVAGKTFRYGEKGPMGLCGGKKVIVASSRGGMFSKGSPLASMDHQEAHLRDFFGFLGIEDLSVVRAEGLAMGPAAREQALASAHVQITDLAVAVD
jgi:FMN-dependent NADH-azoreductase